MAQFIDRVTLHAQGGNGGSGCNSIRREKYRPLGGPNGGNGGHGGSVVLRVNDQINTLLEFHYHPHQNAANGSPGEGDDKNGKNGKDTILDVPKGTVVKTLDGQLIADLHSSGVSYVLARGGIGGKGNAALASPTRKAPSFALLGEPGQKRSVVLELKSMADAALVGFPSCGKSSLIGAMSAARPQVADYPFTTLQPHLGVVDVENYRYTVADVPGLIPGASRGKGLGLDFLRHIERCSVIVHVVDLAVLDPQRSPSSDIEAIEKELKAYEAHIDTRVGKLPMGQRPRIIVLNKNDVPEAGDLAEIDMENLQAFGWPIVSVSALQHDGIRELTLLLGSIIERVRPLMQEKEEASPVLRPQAMEPPQVSVTRIEKYGQSYFSVTADHVRRWVAQTDFSNDHAVSFLAERLKRGGIEDRLLEAGARRGDAIIIGDVVFDFDPHVEPGAELLSLRGLESHYQQLKEVRDRHGERAQRRTNRERRRQYRERMDAKTRARAQLEQERKQGKWTDPSQG